MPWFSLHIRCNDVLIEDDEGAEFPHLAAARIESVRSIRSLVSGDVRDGKLQLDLSIEIRDGDGSQLESVSFDDAITIIPPSPEGAFERPRGLGLGP